VTLYDGGVWLLNGAEVIPEAEAAQAPALQGKRKEDARKGTIAYSILEAHNISGNMESLKLKFDAMASHDITFVGIIQTAKASGMEKFPLPYVLTNCHNSLCAVGGTINEDDHIFGLACARKYGGIFVPTNQAVIHQYVREQLVESGGMILGSDSHTRYGALGVMGFGEGGGELVKQILKKTYDLKRPEVILVWLKGSPKPSTGPQDVALALIKAVFKSGFVKNKILEFHGPGIANLSVEFRQGLDVMTTETTCLSSLWETDEQVLAYYEAYGRGSHYQPLSLKGPAAYDGLIEIELDKVPSMLALPFHPSLAYPIEEFQNDPLKFIAEIKERCVSQYGELGEKINLENKVRDGHFYVDQGIIAGCAGGSFENIAQASEILANQDIGQGAFSLSLYPASQAVALNLVKCGAYTRLMQAGCLLKPSFCGPCFGAGDTPSNGAFSIRHSTRNFPNREGSKPGQKQLSLVALMDAKSIAATALNQGRLTAASELDWDQIKRPPKLEPDLSSYAKRVYVGFGKAKPSEPLILGPNITDWPKIKPLPKNLWLKVASVIHDPVTTTDELIPSGETSSLRSNPLKLAEFTLSRKDPFYVERAKEFQKKATENPLNYLKKFKLPEGYLNDQEFLKDLGFGTTIVAKRPGDGSAREQAASCQKVLGGWANIALDYATKRYRSNLINWGLVPFIIDEPDFFKINLENDLLLLNLREALEQEKSELLAYLLSEKEAP
ncbi:MAG: hydratase, partial [Desulfovibrionaceae bacterium]|nr:hydratase [Desulfovibrionaceae bacterium]